MHHATTFSDWLDTTYRPIMGRETVEEEAETGSAGPEGSESDEGTEASGDGQETEGSEGEGSEESYEDDDAPEEIDRIRDERDATRKELAAAQAAIQKLRAEARKAREEAAKKGGNWEQVAKEREAELADANDRAQNAETRAITAEDKLDSFQREVRVSRIATRLGFRDPGDAIKLLSSDVTGEDKVAERALRKLVEDKPYLVDQRRATGRAMGDGSRNGGLTWEQVKNMSQDEINARWEEVQPVLQSRGMGGSRPGGG